MISSRRFWTGFALLVILIAAVYSNTLKASWQLDDRGNITNCKNLHISKLSIDSLWQSIHFNGSIHRPISRLSLALNYYAGGLNVTGYHLVNISIHFFTAFFLFLSVILLFQTPNLAGHYTNSQYFIALLAAVFWALNPVQIQAVTYIVQRMASLATLFTIISIFFYLKARLTPEVWKKVCFFSGSTAAFLFGLGSKENAAMLPINLILIEFVFFQYSNSRMTRKNFWVISAIAFLTVLLAGLVFLKLNRGDLFWFLDYGRRYFTLPERILTEPRIIIFYLSLLFYPVPTRLSLEHIPQISISLFAPWTTIAAIILIILLIYIAFYYVRRVPFLSFAILFFFLNHVIESTILPLELVFEHRNYLPSLFLFVPVAAGLKWLIDRYRYQNLYMYYLLTGFVVMLIIGLGTGTYVRNMAWKTEKILMEDAIQKEPKAGRAYHNLAFGYYEKIGNFDKAKQLYKKANKLPHHSRDSAPQPLFNLGSIHEKQNEFQKTLEYWKRALEIYPEHQKIRFSLARFYAKKMNMPKKAEACLRPLLIEHPDKAKALNLKGYIFMKQGKTEKALKCFKKCYELNTAWKNLFVNTGKAHALLHNFSLAELYFKQAYSKTQRDINLVFWLIHTALAKENRTDLERFTKLVTEKANIDKIRAGLQTLKERGIMPEKNQQTIRELLTDQLKEQAKLVFQPEK